MVIRSNEYGCQIRSFWRSRKTASLLREFLFRFAESVLDPDAHQLVFVAVVSLVFVPAPMAEGGTGLRHGFDQGCFPRCGCSRRPGCSGACGILQSSCICCLLLFAVKIFHVILLFELLLYICRADFPEVKSSRVAPYVSEHVTL